MKNCKRIFCALLSFLMTVPIAIVGAGAADDDTAPPEAPAPGTVLYVQDFENVSDVDDLCYTKSDSTAYNGTITFALSDTLNGQSNRCLSVKNDTSTWALHQLVPEEVTKNVEAYTISYKMQLDYGSRTWHNMVGVRIGAYTSDSASGTWVTTYWPMNDGWRLQSYDSSNTSVANAVASDVDLADDEKAVRNIRIAVDNAGQTVALYVDGVKMIEQTGCQLGAGPIHLMVEQSVAWVDDICVTAGGIEDVPTAVYGVQTTEVKGETPESAGTYDMRFVGTFCGELANINQVGFRIVASWNEGGAAKTRAFQASSDTVYSSLNAQTGGDVDRITAAECGGDYLFALTITGIPADTAVTFTVLPYAVAEGGTVTGTPKSITASRQADGSVAVGPADETVHAEAAAA